MNDLILKQDLTMSSLEIAKLTGKEHKNVLADVDNMVKELEIRSAEISADYQDAMNRTQRMFNLNKELTFTLISGYSIKLRNKIIKRWQELENTQPRKLPQTYLEALKELIVKEEENERLRLENLHLKTLCDTHFSYYSILRVSMHTGIESKKFNWRPLKATALSMGLEIKESPCSVFGTRKLYPLDSWKACYPEIDISDLEADAIIESNEARLISIE